jgi:hypothetical protein
MGGKSSSIIKFDSTIHNLYMHNNKDYDYIIQSKDSNINVEEKYSHHRPAPTVSSHHKNRPQNKPFTL